MTRSRPLGSAHRGLTAFLVQRVTSLYLGGFTIYLIVYLLLNPIKDYAAWTGYFSAGAVRLAWAIFIVSLLAHTWVGLRSIYMDYLKLTWVRFTVSLLTALALIAMSLWAAQILIRGVV
ncbi:MAG: succinate dehydrogenase, hydrophobic membrane anchor protein [Gammaproteobacteria bacterium]|nr:succinate dehydrogenase, hydrophobic membrane anchor protein [Gammaproteobacteria bacterium]